MFLLRCLEGCCCVLGLNDNVNIVKVSKHHSVPVKLLKATRQALQLVSHRCCEESLARRASLVDPLLCA